MPGEQPPTAGHQLAHESASLGVAVVHRAFRRACTAATQPPVRRDRKLPRLCSGYSVLTYGSVHAGLQPWQQGHLACHHGTCHCKALGQSMVFRSPIIMMVG